ncbi:MAG: transposase [Spirochaetes bacterium]|nr:transposase [Spirochaetota bacterium]
MLDQPTREALCQYIVRAPISLQRIRWDEKQDTVTWSASPSGFFKGRTRHYSSLDFIAQMTLHIPPRGRHLLRRYGLYSSRGRGTWKSHPTLRSRAPASWYGRNATADPALPDAPKDQEVDALSRRRAWARLLAKVHELDIMACPRCGSRMAVIAVITDPAQIRKITDCLDRHGRGPPPLGRGSTSPRG